MRPNVANIDCVNIVIGAPPKPDYLLIDKIIISAISGGAEVVITVNKSDLSTETYDYVLKNYANSVDKIFSVSSVTGENIDSLKEFLKGKLCAFCGQSAVGKTSLLNKLFSMSERVGNLSEKTMRGKHTTTSSEIHFYEDFKVIDTPGFSANICEVKADEIKDYYRDFTEFSNGCYFLDCKHISEPDCAVKQALLEGKISKDRYDRYIEIFNERKKEEKYEKY